MLYWNHSGTMTELHQSSWRASLGPARHCGRSWRPAAVCRLWTGNMRRWKTWWGLRPAIHMLWKAAGLTPTTEGRQRGTASWPMSVHRASLSGISAASWKCLCQHQLTENEQRSVTPADEASVCSATATQRPWRLLSDSISSGSWTSGLFQAGFLQQRQYLSRKPALYKQQVGDESDDWHKDVDRRMQQGCWQHVSWWLLFVICHMDTCQTLCGPTFTQDAQWPWLVQQQLVWVQTHRGISNPGYQVVGSVTDLWYL